MNHKIIDQGARTPLLSEKEIKGQEIAKNRPLPRPQPWSHSNTKMTKVKTVATKAQPRPSKEQSISNKMLQPKAPKAPLPKWVSTTRSTGIPLVPSPLPAPKKKIKVRITEPKPVELQKEMPINQNKQKQFIHFRNAIVQLIGRDREDKHSKIFFNGDFPLKHFVGDALEEMLEQLDENETTSVEKMEQILLAKAEELYSPEEKPAGEVFGEEEMAEVVWEYDSHPEYYEDYDQKLLDACILCYVNESSDAWKKCPLTRYRLGNSKEDFNYFKEQIKYAMSCLSNTSSKDTSSKDKPTQPAEHETIVAIHVDSHPSN